MTQKFVYVPALSAKYLYTTVQKLGFSHKDQKDTVVHHLHYLNVETHKGIFLTEEKATEILHALIDVEGWMRSSEIEQMRTLANTIDQLSDELYLIINGEKNG